MWMKIPKRTSLIANLALCFSSSFAAAEDFRLAISEVYANAQGWTIGRNKAGGCLAAAGYKDGTSIWIGFDPSGRTVLAVHNEKWKTLEAGRTYKMRIRIRNRAIWTGEFVGFTRDDENGLVAIGLKGEFLDQIAAAGGMRLFYEDKVVTGFELSGSRAALLTTLDCQKEFYASNQKPPSGSTKTDDSTSKGWSFGTGFFVSKIGHVLTNNHVISDCKSTYVIITPDKTRYGASLMAKDGKTDLALLLSTLKPSEVPPLNLEPKIGEAVYVFGFPEPGFLASSGNFTIGNVTALAGVEDDTSRLQISAPVHGGNSGGPLNDKYGNVMGVIVSKLVGNAYQTVNFAIKSSIAANFLQSNNIKPETSRKTKELDPTDIALQAKDYTVQIACQ